MEDKKQSQSHEGSNRRKTGSEAGSRRKHTFHRYHGSGDSESPKDTLEFEIVTEKGTNQPRKLGDGNFGMVFEAAGAESYALKVLYDLGNSTKLPPNYELKIARHLRENLGNLCDRLEEKRKTYDGVGNNLREPKNRLVLPEAYSENFRDFVGKSNFERQKVRFSNHAYIMEKFDKSLKDLLESGNPLSRATVKELERSAMPIIEQTARALQTLHAGGFRHQDIKPANIYYKQDGDRINFKLGDLGYLRRNDEDSLLGTVAGTRVPAVIGTKHYRSIEQIDFTDCAECSVAVMSVAPNEKRSLRLKTPDPKFRKTIMREGDFACLAKADPETRPLLKIEEITFPAESSASGEVQIRVETDPETPANAIKLDNDAKTQVLFYKNSTAKTDLFGLAGILYEIVTCGKSPEGFYQLLRPFDDANGRIDRRIMAHYDRWRNRTLEDAPIGAIFSTINRSDSRLDLVHDRVLYFILKCMMSNAEDSHYYCCKFNPNTDGEEALEAWEKIIGEINEIIGIVGAGAGSDTYRHQSNILTRREKETVSSHAKQNSGEEGKRDLISAEKLVHAYSCETPRSRSHWLTARALMSLLSDALAPSGRDANEKDAWLNLLAPESLTIEPEEGNQNCVHFRRKIGNPLDGGNQKTDDKIEGLNDVMLALDPWLTRGRRVGTQFEPVWWQYGTLFAEFKFARKKESAANPENKGKYSVSIVRHLEFGRSVIQAEEGDFILVTEEMHPALFKIEKIEKTKKQEMIVNWESSNGTLSGGRSSTPEWSENGCLIKRPDPVEYHAGMLGTYMYHFLIHGSPGIIDFPNAIYAHIRNHANCRCFAQAPLDESSVFSVNWGNPGRKWARLRNWTVRLILWLSLGGHPLGQPGSSNQAEGKRSGEPRSWTEIHEQIARWSKAVGELTGCKVVMRKWDFARKPGDARKLGDSDQAGVPEYADHYAIRREEWESIGANCSSAGFWKRVRDLLGREVFGK